MKILKKQLLHFILLILLFASCSSSDDNKIEDTFSGICESAIVLKAYAGQQTTTDADASTSLGVLLKDYDYIPPITKGVFLTNTTSVEINGLKEGVVLNNFTLTINGLTHEFGTVSYNDTILYTNETTTYFKNVFDKMIQQERLNPIASFKPNIAIDEKANVKVNLKFAGAFSYWK